ncbi:hypothetical protein NMY22_g10328 [Coprinellus aureogranulatus]|nr:hypothetical protein NMY22_g10328 [Coprinellus aureogranulatus]
MKKQKMTADGSENQKGKSAGIRGLSNELMQLRKICEHPFLFESVEDKVNPTGFISEKLIRASAKVELLHRILPKFFAINHRVLIFFQMTKCLRLDGGTKTEERASFVQLFNQENSEHKVFILSTRAGGLGLNLQTADTVIICVASTLTRILTLVAGTRSYSSYWVSKMLSGGMPIPEHIRQAIRVPNSAISDLEKTLQPPDVPSRIVDAAVKVAKNEGSVPPSAVPAPASEEPKHEEPDVDPATLPKGPFLEDNVDSGIYPYNAYRHPFTHLKRSPETDPKLFNTRLQRLIIPTIMPAGLDAHQILNERERFIEARIQQRIRELEALPSTIGDGDFETNLDLTFGEGVKEENEKDTTNTAPSLDIIKTEETFRSLIHPPPTAHGKLRAIIELKSLRVLEKQRAMRAQVAERLTHGSLLPINRIDFRRTRKPTIRNARNTEELERKQRADRERKAKHKHVEQIGIICHHGRAVLEANRNAQDRITRLGRAVLNSHAQTEKEEQKRIERLAKERLKALKADDKEAYMKLIDTAKDTRITHLLRQTDAYLDSLASAVVAQQVESGLAAGSIDGDPTSEATFGAQVNLDKEDKNRKVDYYAIAHRIKETVRQPSILVGGTLKEYQIKGLQWMVSLYNNRLNGILADEMGLGKTIQTISLITSLIEVKRQRGPYLVIVPLSTMTNWSGEFAKWSPSVRMISYKGNPAQRRALQMELRSSNFQVLLTTYEYIIKDRPVLCKIKWLHMIIDEGHRMKNTQSKLVQTLTTYYHSRYRLILTGTPLQNNLPELWALLNFVLPKVFNSVKSFDEWFNTPFANAGTGDKIELNEEEALLIIKRLHKVLRPFLLRRLKKDVESELPDKVEKVIKVCMSALQSQLYKQMKKYKMIADGSENQKGKSAGIKGLSNELMQLRKICQHPFLFESVEDKVNPTGFIDEKLIRASGKVELLHRILPKFFATNHRVLIFFQMTKCLRLDGELFREIPDGKEDPYHFQLVQSPIPLVQISERCNSGYYKNVPAYRDDWRLMSVNARTYNQESSWVYIVTEGMEEAFNAVFEKHIVGTDMPDAPAASAASTAFYDLALTPMEEDERPPLSRSRITGRKTQILIDDEGYLTLSDDN